MILTVQNTKFSIRHRYVCNSGCRKGTWRDSYLEAEAEASKHMDDNPSHIADVETEQRQNTITQVRK